MYHAVKGDVFNPDRSWGVVRYLTREECEEIDGDAESFGHRTEVIAELMPADNGDDERCAVLFAAAPTLLDEAEKFAADYAAYLDSDDHELPDISGLLAAIASAKELRPASAGPPA